MYEVLFEAFFQKNYVFFLILGFPLYLVVPKAPLDLVSAIYAKLPTVCGVQLKCAIFQTYHLWHLRHCDFLSSNSQSGFIEFILLQS